MLAGLMASHGHPPAPPTATEWWCVGVRKTSAKQAYQEELWVGGGQPFLVAVIMTERSQDLPLTAAFPLFRVELSQRTGRTLLDSVARIMRSYTKGHGDEVTITGVSGRAHSLTLVHIA